jgi:hypothetical protein
MPCFAFAAEITCIETVRCWWPDKWNEQQIPHPPGKGGGIRNDMLFFLLPTSAMFGCAEWNSSSSERLR